MSTKRKFVIGIIIFLFFLGSGLPEYINGICVKPEWSLSPYPFGHDFAFTIVHDADHSNSQRLQPLFNCFNKFGMKISVTTFAFWPSSGKVIKEDGASKDPYWSPTPLPFSEPKEAEFYKKLESEGHEIDLHTASDESDRREETIAAFEFFEKTFGHSPKLYVEHRNQDNLECQQEQGSTPDSPFFVTDILNKYGSWVWVISPSALPYEGRGDYYDVLSHGTMFASSLVNRTYGMIKGFVKSGSLSMKNGDDYLSLVSGRGPFDEYSKKKFGVVNAFRRSGKRDKSDGDGFLEWYSINNIDTLSKNRGTAIVYTHFDKNWLDKNTKDMREDIKERLRYIAGKNVWLAPAGEILARFKAMSNVFVVYDAKWVKVINNNPFEVRSISLLDKNGKGVTAQEVALTQFSKNVIVIDKIGANQTVILKVLGQVGNNGNGVK